MASKTIYTVVAVVGIAAASGAAWWLQQPKAKSTDSVALVSAPGAASGPAGPGAAAGGRPPSVEVARVEVVKLTDDTQAVGSLRSRRGVVLRPEVSGRITQLNFTDGQRVKKGQLLVQFDDQLPLAQVQQSLAELSIAQASQKRNQELVAQNFVSQRSLDESTANLQVAQAKLSLSQATAARLKILAPFDGIVGIRQVNVGDYLKDGADIVNLEDIDAIFIDFRLPERFQAKVKPGQTAMLDMDALPGRKYSAKIQAIDPLIDANGRSVGIRGCIDNRQLQLRPGMFARVNAVFGVRENARVVPEEAIVPQGGKQFVIKVVPGDTPKVLVSQRVEVKVGLRSPGKVEILDGLEPGDTVVVAGQQRLQRDGTAVNVVDLSGAKPSRAPDAPAGGASSAAKPDMSAPMQAASAPAKAASAAPAPLVAASAAGVKTPGAGDKPLASQAKGPNPCDEPLAGHKPAGQLPGKAPGKPA
ncbi:MAG: efflux RND transporter periplasmic adaptor subunit [Polaromonas sp.]|nr:MAG: efflux RND transporter periplasmic adaptor subunit [Polaromonas sp.]